MLTPTANPGKNLTIDVNGIAYQRIPIKTHVVKKEDNLFDLIEKYVKPNLQENDLVFSSERMVAITQGRSYYIKDIKPSKLANFLVKFVHKSPYGIGLGSPWTMELAIREVGAPRILLAAFVSAITKPFGIKGLFYHIAGRQAAAIDGPCSYTLPPYNECATLGPKNPNKVAKELKEKFGHNFVIIDANDLGVDILGRSDKNLTKDFCKAVFRDNPLGQSSEQTPLCIVRKCTTNN